MKSICNKIFIKKIIILVAVLWLACLPVLLFAQDEEEDFDTEFEKTAQLIVMLRASYDGVEEFGSGIIFGRRKDQLLIATAWHILHRGALTPQKISVSFKKFPDKNFEGKLLQHGSENGLDLAVLEVGGLAAKGVNVCDISFDRLGITDELKRRDSVYPVGNPNGVGWAITPEPDKISEIKGNNIVFQSSSISSGHSGGALLNKDACLVGMIVADQPPFGRVLNIDSILKQVRRWNYPVQLMPVLDYQTNALHWFAYNGDVEGIKNVLEICGGNVNVKDEHESSPLHYAAGLGKVAAITMLLKSGANINAVDADGNTPLHYSLKEEKWETAKLLVKAGAKLTIKDHDGRIAAYWANKAEILKYFIDSGIDVNAPDNYGFTFLQNAAAAGDVERIKLLLKAGSKVNQANEYGATPLINAVKRQSEEAMNLLLKAGAHPNVKATFGITPLMTATIGQWKTGVITLLKAGADLNAIDDSGYTSLGLAISHGYPEMATLLRSLGAKN